MLAPQWIGLQSTLPLCDANSRNLLLIRLAVLAWALFHVWTVWDALRRGSIQMGRAWYRMVDRDDDPIEFWWAILANVVAFCLAMCLFVYLCLYA